MKRYIFYSLILWVLFCSGCREEEIILSKPGEAIDPVTNLEYAIAESNATLTWNLPANLPDDIIEPVSVLIRVTEDGNAKGSFVVEDAPESFTYSLYDPSKTYRFTVKVQGAVDTSDPYRSKLRISPGKTVAF
jgi:hypothetical protein